MIMNFSYFLYVFFFAGCLVCDCFACFLMSVLESELTQLCLCFSCSRGRNVFGQRQSRAGCSLKKCCWSMLPHHHMPCPQPHLKQHAVMWGATFCSRFRAEKSVRAVLSSADASWLLGELLTMKFEQETSLFVAACWLNQMIYEAETT